MMPAAATDRQLLSRFVRLGDQSAFSTLVARHLGLVRSVALRRSGGDPALADEIAQNVFAILARKASKVKPGASLAGWLWQTAYFEAAKAQRKEALHRQRIETFRTETSGAGFIPPGENLAWEKVRPALDQALTELSPADREIIFLRYYQNQSYRAIGLQLGKSEGACQKQASRALQKLGRLMRGHGVLLSGAAVPLDRLLSLQQMQVAASSHGAGAVAVSQSALASSASLGPFQVLSHTLQTMAYGKTKTAAAIALLAAIPIGMQWAENQELRRRLTQNGPVLSQVSVLPGSSTIQADDVAAGNAVARRPHPSLIEPGSDKRMTVAAWEQALLQPDPLERARLLSALLEALDASSAPAVAQAFQRVAHSGGEFEEDFRLFLRAWGGLDGQAALDHLSESGRELGNNPETLAALSGWAASDPGAAQSWIQTFEDGDTREHLVYGLLDGWSLVDFSAAAAFAESRPRSEARSRFIELLFRRSIAQNGFSAAQDWVSSIAGDERNETYKRQAFDRVVRAMVY
ncbi:MAG TPA: sigma-70 family RNA polymerase sigma factor, partial [Verrucomicrobiales bacterium]|nr:sigma-70 family RNA polymerase sigma factor [Verrucomicrobiales bacterium]